MLRLTDSPLKPGKKSKEPISSLPEKQISWIFNFSEAERAFGTSELQYNVIFLDEPKEKHRPFTSSQNDGCTE